MNTEEKAKAYEMALEAARKELGVDRKEWEVVQQVLCNIFPELAKSDNERIRHWLIGLISADYKDDNFPSGIKKTDVLNWLKKESVVYEQGMYYYDGKKFLYCQQEKPKVAIPTLDSVKKNKSDDERILASIADCVGLMGEDGDVFSNHNVTKVQVFSWLEKQKEQKPVPIKPDDKQMLERIMELVEFCNDKETIWNWLCEKVKEQKPAENHTLEFEKAKAKYEGIVEGKQTVLDNPEDYGLYKPGEWDEEDIKKIRSEEYTKGFNDAAFGGKLKEWSVEDEDRIRQIERIAQEAGCTQKLQEEIHDWLKSLRPQPQGTYKQVIHTIFGMLKDKDFYEIQPSHRVSLLNDIRVKCKDAIECAPILDEPSWKSSEEDKQYFDDLIARIEKSRRTNRCYVYSEDVDWLKSKLNGNSGK